jgi:hypothetical protein
MSLYDRVRYRLSLDWICFYYWMYRKVSSVRAAMGSNTVK